VLLAGDGGRSQNCASYMGNGRGWLAGDWPSTGGLLNITVAAWTAGFHWWHSGNIMQMQNVSKYMLVLALCLVTQSAVGRGSVLTHVRQSVCRQNNSKCYRLIFMKYVKQADCGPEKKTSLR